MHLNLNNSIKYWFYFFFFLFPQTLSPGALDIKCLKLMHKESWRATDGFNSWRATTGNVGGRNFSQRDVCLWLTKLFKRRLGMSGIKPTTHLAPSSSPQCLWLRGDNVQKSEFRSRQLELELNSRRWNGGGGLFRGCATVLENWHLYLMTRWKMDVCVLLSSFNNCKVKKKTPLFTFI